MAKSRNGTPENKGYLLGAVQWCTLCAVALAGCASLPPPVKSWDSFPRTLALSSELSDCHIRTYHEAAWFLEAQIGRRLFDIELVSPEALSVSGLPPLGVIGVAPGPRSTPEALSDTRLFFEAESTGRIHSASITAGMCSFRSAAHETSHALGLDHVLDPSNLLYEVDSDAALVLTPDQVTQILSGSYSRAALTPPTAKTSTTRATTVRP
jgi:hypothetical protein